MSYASVLARNIANDLTLRNVLLITASSLLIAVSAQFTLLIPFISLVPFSLQCSVVLLLSALLGSKRAVAAVALYLVEGASGLPFFVRGNSGILYLMGPTGGYLLSYLIVSYLTGLCFEKFDCSTWSRRVACFVVNNCIILACGVCWLSCYLGFEKAWMVGAYPFLGTDLVKIFVMAGSMPLANLVKSKL